MVVLAASIINKTGRALVSRQFVAMTRIRMEGLLAAFPKLVGSGKQHTYVETENVRYVYQPLEALYLILVTNRQSNILEDLETLRLLSKEISEQCHNLEEEAVSKNAFEIIFAFDEVISLGHKEAVTPSQVKEYLEMDSHEERMHKMLMQSKIDDTKQTMKEKARQIDKSKLDNKLRSDKSIMNNIRFDNGYSDNGFKDIIPPPPVRTSSASSSQQTAAKKGMQLGKTQKVNQFLESLKAEGEVIVEDIHAPASGALALAPVTEPIAVSVDEKLTVVLKNDGGIENFELKGTFALVVQSSEHASIRIQVETGANADFEFKTHPNIDKEMYTRQNILALKDSQKSFPLGSPNGILKWRLSGKNEGLVPLTISCWPSVSGSLSYVSIEYEAQPKFELQNVSISIPLPALREPPTVNHIDGEWRYDSRKSTLEWSIVLIDNSNRSGSMEFVVPSADQSAFFPIDVKFTSRSTYCNIKAASVTRVRDNEPVAFGGNTLLQVDSYQVV